MTGSHEIYTGSDSFSIVVDHYGNAKGTRSQFSNSDPASIDGLIRENISAFHLATETLSPQLAQIKSDLEACWEGASADEALSTLGLLTNNATSIGTNTKACGDSFTTFQSSWVSLKGQADGLYEGVAGSGVNQDNDGAHRIYKAFNDSMQTSMHSMPSRLQYDEPLGGFTPAGPGPTGGGPGGGGPGAYGPGGYGPGGHGPGGWGPGSPGPGSPGPGSPGPGSPGPGPGGYSPGPGLGTMPIITATPQRSLKNTAGQGGGAGTGAGLDTGTQLAGYTGGAGSGPGAAGPGAFGPGPGGATLTTATSGLGSGIGPGAVGLPGGIAGVGAGETAAGQGSRGMMGSRGGAGDDEDERERSTWLSEEEGIWDGDTDVPPGIIA